MPTYAQLQAEPWWNREIYTDAMRWLAGALTKHFGTPTANAGCKGDNNHLNGGHRSQEWILNSRYCTNRTYAVESGLSGEQVRYLSAFDYTPASRDVMLQISQRIDRATRGGSLEEVVEWFGNTDGDQRVDGWNNIRNAVISSDSSHLWHLHFRVARRYANDMSVAQRIFSVLTGAPKPSGDAEMNSEESRMLRNIAEWVGAQLVGRDKVTGIAPGPGDEHATSFPNTLLNGVEQVAIDVAELKPTPGTTVQIDAAAVAALRPVIKAAVREVLREGTDAPGNV